MGDSDPDAASSDRSCSPDDGCCTAVRDRDTAGCDLTDDLDELRGAVLARYGDGNATEPVTDIRLLEG